VVLASTKKVIGSTNNEYTEGFKSSEKGGEADHEH